MNNLSEYIEKLLQAEQTGVPVDFKSAMIAIYQALKQQEADDAAPVEEQ